MPTFINDDGDEPGIGPPGHWVPFKEPERTVVVKGNRANKVYPSEPTATEKQVKFAKWIANTLNISLPVKETKKAYSEFIGKNKPKFEEKLALQQELASGWSDDPEWGPEPEY